MKSYETKLPQGYTEAKTIDAKDKKIGLWFNLAGLPIIAVFLVVGLLVFRPWDYDYGLEDEDPALVAMCVFVAVNVVQTAIHELLHGVAYKILTRQKLTFGLTLTVAYCGVPDIYVYRRTALISLLAPFVVLGITFTLLTVFLVDQLHKFLAIVMLGIHVAGCVGDLYDTILFLFKFKSPDVLMRDTGPKQTFYVKTENQGEQQ